MSDNMFYSKYLKYKQKYLELKKIQGGNRELGNVEEYYDRN